MNCLRFLKISCIYKIEETYFLVGSIFDSCETEYNKIYVYPLDFDSHIILNFDSYIRSYEYYKDNNGTYLIPYYYFDI